MQGLADGYFVLPYTIQNYLADQISVPKFTTDAPEFAAVENEVKQKLEKLLTINGKKSVDTFHRELGLIMWEHVGMARNADGLKTAIEKIKVLKTEFWKNVYVPGSLNGQNTELEKATRVADFIELGELMARDALVRNESCGGHFREEYQTEEGEALRDDENFKYVSAWEYKGENQDPQKHNEDLNYEFIEVKSRNYKS
jgi:succinate dehydrogenase / fumarate reductase flavoprotein subunit